MEEVGFSGDINRQLHVPALSVPHLNFKDTTTGLIVHFAQTLGHVKLYRKEQETL